MDDHQVGHGSKPYDRSVTVRSEAHYMPEKAAASHRTACFSCISSLESILFCIVDSCRMQTTRRTPLLSGIEMRSTTSVDGPYGDSDIPEKRWYHYLPLCGTFVIKYSKSTTFSCTILRNHNHVIGASSVLALCPC